MDRAGDPSLLGCRDACKLLCTGGWEGGGADDSEALRRQGAGPVLEEPVVGMAGAGGGGSRLGRAVQAACKGRGEHSRVNTLGCPICLVWLWTRHFTSLSLTFLVGLLVLLGLSRS